MKFKIRTKNFIVDRDGKSVLNLTPMPNVIVNTRTQDEFDCLVRTFRLGGWEPRLKILNPKIHSWKIYGKETCVDARPGFMYGKPSLRRNKNSEVIQVYEFYEAQEMNVGEVLSSKNLPRLKSPFIN